jgi:hypothetical protein
MSTSRKYGKKNVVKIDPLAYNICILGESKIGKTTVVKEFLEKLVGDEGYMFLEMAGEAGADAINGIVAEDIDEWGELQDILDDIEDNRTTDYKDLKTIVVDTYDGWIKLAENEVIRKWNRNNIDKKADSINATEGGFQKGQAKAFDLMFEVITRLKKIGISTIIIGHVKNRDITDIASGTTYQTLTSDVEKIYFNLLKKKMHFIGLAYYDRTIITEKTGKKNIVTKKDITVNKVTNESRKIKFRDDNMALDSGSRFANIIEEINLDADELINAIKDAIKSEYEKTGNIEQMEDIQKQQENEKNDKMNKELSKTNNLKEIEDIKIKIKEFAKSNVGNKESLKPLLDKVAELGIKSPIDFNDIETARQLMNAII